VFVPEFQQLNLLGEDPGAPKGGWLCEALSKQEQREMRKAYVEHQGLIKLMGAKMIRKYSMVETLDVYSCIDMAFIKSWRAWDPAKGKFSTIFTSFASGEIRHFIRDHNFAVKAPNKVRALSSSVRRLAGEGHALPKVAELLGVTEQAVKDSLIATAGMYHEQMDWEHHQCPRPTPLETLIAEEAIEMGWAN
jgi:DNA-directed RNA polymerase specialized sigma subunit